MSVYPMNWWLLESTSLNYLGDLVGLLVRTTAFSLLAVVAEFLFRKKAAATRILIWRPVVITLLLLPIAAVLLPHWEISILPGPAHPAFQWRFPGPPVLAEPVWSFEAHRSQGDLASGPSLGTALFLGYSLIGCVLLVRLLAGQWRVERLIAASRPIDGGVSLRESSHVSLPVSAGLLRPQVLLPSDWRRWPEDKLRAVVAHEASHIARHDSAFAFLGALATCIFWFHPVAWFARWRLAELGEEASDNDAIRVSGMDRNRYLEVLLELVETLRASPRPGLGTSLSMARTSRITRRARRILAEPLFPPAGKFAWPLTTGLAALAFLMTASAQLTSKPAIFQPQPTTMKPSQETLTPAQVAEFENRLQLDPEDIKARGNLLSFYLYNEDGANWRRHYFWLLEHHPGSKLLGSLGPPHPFGARMLTGPDNERVKQLWRNALAANPGDPQVLYQGAMFFRLYDSAECELLMRRAYELAPAEPEYLQSLSQLYAEAADSALLFATDSERPYWTGIDMTPSQARAWMARLESSTDPNLLGFAGHYLAKNLDGAAQRPQNVREFGFALVKKAEELDPAFHERWLRYLEDEKARQSKMHVHTFLFASTQPTITVPAARQRERLLQSPEPRYPWLARLISFHGSVRVKIKIDAAGRVERADAVDGFLPVRPAAIDAVKKWRYAPTMHDGQRASVISEAIVSFPPGTP